MQGGRYAQESRARRHSQSCPGAAPAPGARSPGQPALPAPQQTGAPGAREPRPVPLTERGKECTEDGPQGLGVMWPQGGQTPALESPPAAIPAPRRHGASPPLLALEHFSYSSSARSQEKAGRPTRPPSQSSCRRGAGREVEARQRGTNSEIKARTAPRSAQ